MNLDFNTFLENKTLLYGVNKTKNELNDMG